MPWAGCRCSCAAGRLLLDAHFEGGKLGRCTVLHDGVTRSELHGGAIVELEDHATRDHVFEVDRVGRVHPRCIGLHVLAEARELLLQLGGHLVWRDAIG